MAGSPWLEYRPTVHIPKYLKDSINTRIGFNKFGGPRYRLVWAPDRYELSYGIWHDWDENLGVNERNYISKNGDELNKPRRVVEEFRWTPKYPLDLTKWILETWRPPESYGTPLQWFSSTQEGGTCQWNQFLNKSIPVLGDYPWYGDYEYTGYAFPNEALTEAIILNAVGRMEHHIDSLPSSKEGRVKRAKYMQQQSEERREKAWTDRAEAITKDANFAFGQREFIGFGPKHKSDREATAEKLGLSHA